MTDRPGSTLSLCHRDRRIIGDSKRLACWTVADSYLLGPDLLVAPVTTAGATTREVYVPAGARWTCAWTGADFEGGARVTVGAPLERIPLFLRDGTRLPVSA